GMAYFAVCTVTLVASLLLGGGTRGGFLSDAVLQLLSIVLLVAALWRSAPTVTRQMRWAMGYCLIVVLVPLLQLVPLPPSLWTALPGREAEIASFQVLGRDLPWMPISLSPTATWLSLLSLIPPLAIFLGTIRLNYRERRLLSLVLLAVGMVSVFVGLLQVAQGPSSPLRLFEYPNGPEAVGFFANRNHFAALLYCLTLFAAAWAVSSTLDAGDVDRAGLKIVAIAASFTVLVVLIAAQAMARSRAGLGLT